MVKSNLHDDFLIELIESMRNEVIIQKTIRNKMIILKYVFLKTALIAALINLSKMLKVDYILTLLSITIIYLDLVACQKGVAINRVGRYLKNHLETYINECCNNSKIDENSKEIISEGFEINFWERYFSGDRRISRFSKIIAIIIGNISLTLGLVVLSIYFELIDKISEIGIIVLVFTLICGSLWDITLNLRNAGIIGKD